MDEKYTLNLDRPRKLKFGFKAIRTIKEKFGNKNLEEALSVAVDEVPYFIWIGLAWEDDELTVEKVVDLLDEKIPDTYKIMDILNILVEAITEQMGVPKNEDRTEEETKDEISSENIEKQPSKSESETPQNSTI